MADTKLTALTPVGAVLDLTDIIYLVRGGVSLSMTGRNLMKGAGSEKTLVIPSVFTPEVNFIFYDGWVAQENITITKGSLFAVTAPTGAGIIVDILINGVAQTKLLTLSAAATHELTDFADLAVTAGQRVGLKITQIGSTEPGNGLTATLYYKLT